MAKYTNRSAGKRIVIDVEGKEKVLLPGVPRECELDHEHKTIKAWLEDKSLTVSGVEYTENKDAALQELEALKVRALALDVDFAANIGLRSMHKLKERVEEAEKAAAEANQEAPTQETTNQE